MRHVFFLPFQYAYELLKVASNSLYWCSMSQSHHQTRADKEGVLFNVPYRELVKPSIETPYIQVLNPRHLVSRTVYD